MRQASPPLLLAVLLAAAAGATAQQPAPAPQATGPTFYVAADEVEWNYAPSGVNLCSGEQFEGGGWPGRACFAIVPAWGRLILILHLADDRGHDSVDPAGLGQRLPEGTVSAVHRRFIPGDAQRLAGAGQRHALRARAAQIRDARDL